MLTSYLYKIINQHALLNLQNVLLAKRIFNIYIDYRIQFKNINYASKKSESIYIPQFKKTKLKKGSNGLDVVNYNVIVISLAFDECVETIRHLLVEENGYVHILLTITPLSYSGQQFRKCEGTDKHTKKVSLIFE